VTGRQGRRRRNNIYIYIYISPTYNQESIANHIVVCSATSG
jgi:hypothetical protein